MAPQNWTVRVRKRNFSGVNSDGIASLVLVQPLVLALAFLVLLPLGFLVAPRQRLSPMVDTHDAGELKVGSDARLGRVLTHEDTVLFRF